MSFFEKVYQAQEKASGLTADILSLERRYGERCGHAENSAEAIDQLAEELHSTQEALEASRERVSEGERLIARLGQRVHMQQEEVRHDTSSRKRHTPAYSQQRGIHSDQSHLITLVEKFFNPHRSVYFHFNCLSVFQTTGAHPSQSIRKAINFCIC